MVHICGRKSDFVGNQETLYINSSKVRELTERYNSLTKRIKLRSEIKKDLELTKKHIGAFELIDGVYGLTTEQEKCFKYIKRIYTKRALKS